MRTTIVIGLVGALIGGCAGLDEDSGDDTLTEATDSLQGAVAYTGNLYIAGCTPPASDILVTATPSIGTAAGDPNAPPPPEPMTAQIIPTTNLHHFKVFFPALVKRATYTFSAGISEANCAKVAWKGPHEGRVTIGVSPGLRIDGYAMRTQTEVLATRGPNHDPVWVGVDAIDLDTEGGAVRDLRWRTDVPNVKGGVVEIATEPFRVGPGTNADNQVPLIATFTVPAPAQGWSVVSAVDIASAVRPPPCDLQQNPNGCPIERTALGALHIAAAAGAPLYVRVVPINKSGKLLSDTMALGIASTVKVAHVKLPVGLVPPPPPPPPAPPLKFDDIYYFEPQPEYARGYNQGCYTITKPHVVPAYSLLSYATDWWGTRIRDAGGYAPGTTFPVGAGWCFNHSSGTLDDIVDAISGLIDAVGAMVNDIAKLYDDIKKAAVKAVGSAIGELGIIDCDEGSDCQKYLMAGLDAALASVGLPPSLPNFDELVDNGLDYLVEVAAEETGVPEAALDEMRDIARQALADMKTQHTFDGVDWLTPDDGFRPAKLMMFIRKNPDSTEPVAGDLRYESGTTFHGTDLRLPTLTMETGSPALFTAQFLPDFSAITPPTPWCDGPTGICFPMPAGEQQLYYEDQWYQRMLDESCEGLTATGYGVGRFGDSGPVFLPGPGMQMQWLLTPSVFTVGHDEPYKYACP